MAIELITGRAGTPHVDSADVGAMNAALFGSDVYILAGLSAELVDANNVRIHAGEILAEGRHIRITGSGETLAIANGLSSYNRNDIIAAKYLRDGSGIETVSLIVIKGSNASGTPTDPAMPISGKLIDGASEVYWPLYRITVNGLTPQAPVAIASHQAAYMLGFGEEIQQGSDMNSYKTPGMYFTTSHGVTASLANRPEEVSGNSALVVREVVNGAKVQQFKSNTNAIGASRYYDSATGTWGEWSYDGGVDAIISEGLSNGWRWVKYASGMAECWRQLTLAAGAKYTNWGTALKYVTIPASSYPFTFTRYWPIVSSTDGNHWPAAYEGGGIQSGNIYMVTPTSTQTSVTTQSVTANVYCIGYWK